MKTYTVCVPVDYLQGHLRYGHFEYSIEANSEEEAIKKLKTIKETIKKMDNGEIPNGPNFMDIDYDDIVVDDYCIDGCGDKLFDEAYIKK